MRFAFVVVFSLSFYLSFIFAFGVCVCVCVCVCVYVCVCVCVCVRCIFVSITVTSFTYERLPHLSRLACSRDGVWCNPEQKTVHSNVNIKYHSVYTQHKLTQISNNPTNPVSHYFDSRRSSRYGGLLLPKANANRCKAPFLPSAVSVFRENYDSL